MGRAGNAFLKMASSSKVRHRPCGEGGMHTQDCSVPHAVNTLFSPNFYNKTLMKSKVRKEKHSFWNGTLWHMPATQEAEAGAQPGQHSESWFQRKGGQRPWEGRRGKTHLYWRCQGLVHAESDPP